MSIFTFIADEDDGEAIPQEEAQRLVDYDLATFDAKGYPVIAEGYDLEMARQSLKFYETGDHSY